MLLDSDDEHIQRIMCSASGPESIRETNKVLLVYRIQHGDSRSLDDLVFEGGDRERPLSSVRLRYVVSSRRHRPIRSPMKPRMQVLKVAPEVCLVSIPCHAIDTRCSICINFIERRLGQFEILIWWKSAVNRSFLLSLATSRMRSNACDTLTRS